MDGEFISTDIRYRGVKTMAGSGDKKDSMGGAAIISGGGMDVVSGGGETDAKDTSSGDETVGRDIDGGASSNIGYEVKVEREKGGATNKVRFASEGADSTGSESTVFGASADNGGGNKIGGGDGGIISASECIVEDTNSSEGVIVNIGDEIKGEKVKGCTTDNIESASGGAGGTGSESTDNGGGDNSGGANNDERGGASIGAVPRISKVRLREILQHAKGGCFEY